MLSAETILFVSLCYIGMLFAVAYYGDKRADKGRSIINSPYVYALSLAVYCTAWTFYGSVGRAASSGVRFPRAGTGRSPRPSRISTTQRRAGFIRPAPRPRQTRSPRKPLRSSAR